MLDFWVDRPDLPIQCTQSWFKAENTTILMTRLRVNYSYPITINYTPRLGIRFANLNKGTNVAEKKNYIHFMDCQKIY